MQDANFFYFSGRISACCRDVTGSVTRQLLPAESIAFNTLQAKYRGRAALNGMGFAPATPGAPAASGAASLVFMGFSCILLKIFNKMTCVVASHSLMLFLFFSKFSSKLKRLYLRYFEHTEVVIWKHPCNFCFLKTVFTRLNFAAIVTPTWL